jgi:hypothetical protein
MGVPLEDFACGGNPVILLQPVYVDDLQYSSLENALECLRYAQTREAVAHFQQLGDEVKDIAVL